MEIEESGAAHYLNSLKSNILVTEARITQVIAHFEPGSFL